VPGQRDELSDELIGRFLQEYVHHPSKRNLYYFSARPSLGMCTVTSAGVFSINPYRTNVENRVSS